MCLGNKWPQPSWAVDNTVYFSLSFTYTAGALSSSIAWAPELVTVSSLTWTVTVSQAMRVLQSTPHRRISALIWR